tara:strand:- start:52 stop:324 length:273 start_codon:yes stop_codon:yes gene_type:complete
MKKKVTDQDIISALNEIIRETNKPQKVELGMVQDILKDTETLKKKYESIQNKSTKLLYDYNKVIDMAKKVGVKMDSKFIAAGKVLKELSK